MNYRTDTIQNFKDYEDLVGLSGGLTFKGLTIAQGTDINRSDTLRRSIFSPSQRKQVRVDLMPTLS